MVPWTCIIDDAVQPVVPTGTGTAWTAPPSSYSSTSKSVESGKWWDDDDEDDGGATGGAVGGNGIYTEGD